MKNTKLIDGIFTSVWDDGIHVSARCLVNLDTREVVVIGENDYPGDDGELDICHRQFVTVGDKEYRVTDIDSYEDAIHQCPNDEWLYY